MSYAMANYEYPDGSYVKLCFFGSKLGDYYEVKYVDNINGTSGKKKFNNYNAALDFFTMIRVAHEI